MNTIKAFAKFGNTELEINYTEIFEFLQEYSQASLQIINNIEKVLKEKKAAVEELGFSDFTSRADIYVRQDYVIEYNVTASFDKGRKEYKVIKDHTGKTFLQEAQRGGSNSIIVFNPGMVNNYEATKITVDALDTFKWKVDQYYVEVNNINNHALLSAENIKLKAKIADLEAQIEELTKDEDY